MNGNLIPTKKNSKRNSRLILDSTKKSKHLLILQDLASTFDERQLKELVNYGSKQGSRSNSKL